jgi:hypothetical protein
MTTPLTKARRTAAQLGLDRVEFRQGLAEELPVPTSWADVVISNGVINQSNPPDLRSLRLPLHRPILVTTPLVRIGRSSSYAQTVARSSRSRSRRRRR